MNSGRLAVIPVKNDALMANLRSNLIKYTLIASIILSCAVFVIKFAGPNLLIQYISYGIGDCKKIPILCMEPEEKIIRPEAGLEDYLQELVPQNFPRMSILCPKGFTIIQELIKRPYYKKNKRQEKGGVIYLLYQEPGEFLKLYPDVRKQGVNNNYEFISRLSSANLNKVKNITDAFFVIMKSVFTPDIGSQKIVRMIEFQAYQFRGFINYNLSRPNSYFDCNIMDSRDNFYKVYIKDKENRLDLNKVFRIISTIKPVNTNEPF